MKVVIIAVLLMLSAICSATETAFSSCNRIRLKKLADDGNKSAKKAMNICDNFDKALTAILVGNNVVNISSSSLATVLFTEKFGKGSVGLATVVMTVLVLIFGEILFKFPRRGRPTRLVSVWRSDVCSWYRHRANSERTPPVSQI